MPSTNRKVTPKPATDPLVPWAELRNHVDVCWMTLHRWKKRGVIDVTVINGRNYLRTNQTLQKLAEDGRA